MNVNQSSMIDENSFCYEGIIYYLFVILSYKLGNESFSVSLYKSNILNLEIVSSLDKLYSQGTIDYVDLNGDISKIVNVYDVNCTVLFSSMKQGGDGDFTVFKNDDKNVLNHVFHVDNIEFTGKQGNSFKYCIHMTGAEYSGLLNNSNYSDYDLNEKKTLTKIIGDLLREKGKLNIDDSFDRINSNVTISYSSSGNDNIQSSIDYLMQKQFFFKDSRDKRIIFLFFDVISDQYKLFSLENSQKTLVSNIIFSLNKTELEEFINKGVIKVASDSSVRKTETLPFISDIVYDSYNFDTNNFEEITIPSNEIIQYFGGQDESLNKLTPNRMNMDRFACDWDNNFNVYRDFLDLFIKWDSVIVNVGGIINRRLMDLVNVYFDNRVEMSVGDTTESVKENMERFNQLNGLWYITKVRHIIKANDGIYKQNIRLSRTYNMK